jgi:hypothetical protein
MSRNVTIAQLHYSWKVGSRAWSAMRRPTFGLISIASIAVSLTAINGPFLQRATRTRLESSSSDVSIGVQIATALPTDWITAFVGGRNAQISVLTPRFTPVVQNFTLGQDILVEPTGCTGTCTTTISGVGFAAGCSDTVGASFNLSAVFDNGTINYNTYEIFSTSFSYALNMNAPKLPGTLSVLYKNTSDCFGDMQSRQCTLQAATVRFPITITSNKTGNGLDAISLTPGTTIEDDTVIDLIDTVDTDQMAQAGGLFYALDTAYASSADVRFGGAIGYQLTTSGSMVNRYAHVIDPAQCSTAFSDPTDEIINAARDLMFRTAIASSNSSLRTTVTAQQISTQQVYMSDFRWLGAATAITVLGLLLTIPTFRGYWKLGRNVSMSPIELAKAFASPMLAHVDSNADVETMLKTMGDRQIRYGASSGADVASSVRLEMENPRLVRRPEWGEVFGSRTWPSGLYSSGSKRGDEDESDMT